MLFKAAPLRIQYISNPVGAITLRLQQLDEVTSAIRTKEKIVLAVLGV
jgi:hypothetical protein